MTTPHKTPEPVKAWAIEVPTYTASIDAALALMKKMVPHVTAWQLKSFAGMEAFTCDLSWVDGESTEHVRYANGATPALAVLTALFSALGENHEAR